MTTKPPLLEYLGNLNSILEELNNIILFFRERRLQYNKLPHSAHLLVLDIQLFIHLQMFDLISHQKHLMLSEIDLEEKLYARLVAMSIYEFINDILEILGRNFRQTVKKTLPNVTFDDLNKIVSELNRFKTIHSQELMTVRNLVIAHREHNPTSQMNIIESIDTISYFHHAKFIYDTTNKLGDYLVVLAKELNTKEFPFSSKL